MVRAAGFSAGGWVMPPPIRKHEAELEFGAEIPESAWREIIGAFRLHGMRLDELTGTRLNQNPNDIRGWKRRKTDAQKGLEAALAGLRKIDWDFLREAEDIVSLKLNSGLADMKASERLNKAWDELLFLSRLVDEAEPLSREIMTEAESRRVLARDVFGALEPFGANLSNGWAIGQKQPSYAQLTGFERLAELMEIHQGDTPAATAKWLRAAMARER